MDINTLVSLGKVTIHINMKFSLFLCCQVQFSVPFSANQGVLAVGDLVYTSYN